MLCFRSFPLAKNIMDKRGWGGVSRFSFEFFVVSQCRKFPLGNPLVFYLFRVSKKFMDNGGVRGGREYQDFPSKICLTAPKNFVAEPFCAVFQKV